MDNLFLHNYFFKSRRLFVCFFVLLLSSESVIGQVAYTRDFQFQEGLFMSFLQFRNNRPIAKSQIISEYDKNDLSFFDQLIAQKEIKYKDSLGIDQITTTPFLWGYSKNNAIYINYDGTFYRMGVIGSLCHFVASITTYVSTPDPFYGMRYGTTTMPVKELMQFVLDAETGRIYNFNIENMENLLKKDDALSKEFASLKRRKQKDSMFIFLRRYNEAHPFYFSAQ